MAEQMTRISRRSIKNPGSKVLTNYADEVLVTRGIREAKIRKILAFSPVENGKKETKSEGTLS